MPKEKPIPHLNSKEYILWCASVIKADKHISEDVIITMFVEYGKKLIKEKLKG